MKKLAVIAVVALSLIGASTTSAASKSTVCAYKMKGLDITVALGGSDLTPAFCNSFNSGFKGVRYRGHTAGTLYCGFRMKDYNIVLAAFSHSRTYGKAFCSVYSKSAFVKNYLVRIK